MAFTAFQRTLCRLIAENRIASGESYVSCRRWQCLGFGNDRDDLEENHLFREMRGRHPARRAQGSTPLRTRTFPSRRSIKRNCAAFHA